MSKVESETHWDDAVATAQLLRIAADLIRDETPFHEEIRALCAVATQALHMEWTGAFWSTAPTVLPEKRFRAILSGILEWPEAFIERACTAVAKETYEKVKGYVAPSMAKKPRNPEQPDRQKAYTNIQIKLWGIRLMHLRDPSGHPFGVVGYRVARTPYEVPCKVLYAYALCRTIPHVATEHVARLDRHSCLVKQTVTRDVFDKQRARTLMVQRLTEDCAWVPFSPTVTPIMSVLERLCVHFTSVGTANLRAMLAVSASMVKFQNHQADIAAAAGPAPPSTERP